MDAAQRESRKHQIDPERKYIRLQEIGLAQLLSLPFIPLLSMVTGLENLSVLVFIAFLISGCMCLQLGHERREELAKQREEQINGDNAEDNS